MFREPYKCSKIDVTTLLWKNEYLQFVDFFPINTSRLNITSIINIIEKVFTVHEFKSICERIFINRYLQDKNFRVYDILDDKEYKSEKIQKSFKELTKDLRE